LNAPASLDEAKYPEFLSLREEGPVIPGIFQEAVPQGLAYLASQDMLLISNYMDDGRQSCITAVSMASGDLVKVFWLEEPNGAPHKGHVGGLAVSARHLWVASGPGVYYVDLDTLASDSGSLRLSGFVETAAKGSFATFAGDTLWVGEFTRSDGSYPVPRSHNVRTPSGILNLGWMAGFTLDPSTDLIPAERTRNGIAYPDRVLSIPHEVQGAAFFRDRIVLCHSYGRQNRSRISVYANPLSGDPFAEFDGPAGLAVPIWVLDETSLERVIAAPPMGEGVALYRDRLAILFESGSDKYRQSALDPLDRIQLLSERRQ
jgi:hypothetical protein